MLLRFDSGNLRLAADITLPETQQAPARLQRPFEDGMNGMEMEWNGMEWN